MAASQLSHRGKKNEVAEGESAAEAYYVSVEAAETLMNPDRGRSPTQSCMHTSAHYCHPSHPFTTLPAALLLQRPAHAQSCKEATFPDVLSPSLRWAELSQSI